MFFSHPIKDSISILHTVILCVELSKLVCDTIRLFMRGREQRLVTSQNLQIATFSFLYLSYTGEPYSVCAINFQVSLVFPIPLQAQK
jgi:hypothetical protein